MTPNSCILCSQTKIFPLQTVTEKSFGQMRDFSYLSCPDCGLTYLSPHQRLADETEKSRYLMHNNVAHDSGYKEHLLRLWRPLKNLLQNTNDLSALKGLDYGSGPVPVLADLIRQEGVQIKTWDVYFSPHQQVLSEQYDFVICNEVAEHFYNPGTEFHVIDKILRPSGYFALGTRFLSENINFKNWSYRKDDTHVCFYSSKTLRWLADFFDWQLIDDAEDTAFFRKGLPY